EGPRQGPRPYITCAEYTQFYGGKKAGECPLPAALPRACYELSLPSAGSASTGRAEHEGTYKLIISFKCSAVSLLELYSFYSDCYFR
uniref:Uncharacterized protein n=1 Tax=Anas zonorhyncha TaxID=75864 RepID=A0A8B9ZVX3_9AVES